MPKLKRDEIEKKGSKYERKLIELGEHLHALRSEYRKSERQLEKQVKEVR